MPILYFQKLPIARRFDESLLFICAKEKAPALMRGDFQSANPVNRFHG